MPLFSRGLLGALLLLNCILAYPSALAAFWEKGYHDTTRYVFCFSTAVLARVFLRFYY